MNVNSTGKSKIKTPEVGSVRGRNERDRRKLISITELSLYWNNYG